jgi:hypothetical protein
VAVLRAEPLTHLIRETLEHELTRIRSYPVRVLDIHRDASSQSSTFRTERLHVKTDDGERPLVIYFKDLNPVHQVSRRRHAHSANDSPSSREIRVYESVLSCERFGTPEYYGSRWEPAKGRCWLFIECVGERMLQSEHDLEPWIDTCRCVAGFHAATRDLPSAVTGFLPVYNEEYYRGCAESVERLLPGLDGADRTVVAQGLDHLRRRISWLGTLPRSVIHGQLFGQNVMLRSYGAAHPVSIIDWETAALGPGVFDLASITSNRRPAEERLAMRKAYFQRYCTRSGQTIEWERFEEEFVAVAVFHHLEWLVWWSRRPQGSRRFPKHVRELRALVEEGSDAPAASC